MCKYCENTNEFNPFIDERVPFLPEEHLDIAAGINEKMLLEIGATASWGNSVFTVCKKINYCPMCGRKL